jgi:hypothetical protein
MAAVYGEFEPGHNSYLVTNLFGSLLKKVASENTVQPPPTPTPTPVAAAPTQPSPTPAQKPENDTTPSTETPAPVTTQPKATLPPLEPAAPFMSNDQAVSGTPNLTTKSDQTSLISLKILMGIFAGIYTFFLLTDSIIIHRAKINRENISSSSHALLFLLVSLVNFFTLWL